MKRKKASPFKLKIHRVQRASLSLYDAAKRFLEAKGSHGRFYAHRDLLEIVRRIDHYKKRRVITSKS